MAVNESFINHPKKALFDFEWQRMTLQKLQMNQESISMILKSLAKAYTADEKLSEAFNCYRELLRSLKPADLEEKLDIISKISPVLQKMLSVYFIIP